MTRVLMIGLDGATFSLLEPLSRDGAMPFLARLLGDGVHADLISTRNPLTPPAWTSMITGRSPHVHGIYDFLRPETTDDGGVFLKVNDSRDNRCETVFSMASRQGRRATALNFYGMSPPPAIDGYVVSGFVPWKHLRKGTHPASLFESIKTMPGFDYKLLAMDIAEEKKCVQGLLDGEHEDWIQLQNDRDTAWADLACHLMESDPTELTAVVLDGPDKLQHLFWRFVDPDLANADDGAWFRAIRAQCLDFYRQLDRNIERLTAAAGPDANVILTSDHGFGPTDEIVYLNEWLARRGYLTWSAAANDDDTGKLTANRMKDHLAMIDWKRTLAFCPTPSSNAIYIKRDNGSGHGVADADYLEFCMALRRELLDYRDPATGEPVVVAVDANKLEGRPYVEPSPDLTLHLRDGGFVSILKSAHEIAPREHVDGTHRPNGIFIAAGPDIKSDGRIAALDLLDIAPLMLHLLGLSVPRDLEGRVPVEALTSAGTVERGGESAKAADDGYRGEASAEERDALMKQLKILGYMD